VGRSVSEAGSACGRKKGSGSGAFGIGGPAFFFFWGRPNAGRHARDCATDVRRRRRVCDVARRPKRAFSRLPGQRTDGRRADLLLLRSGGLGLPGRTAWEWRLCPARRRSASLGWTSSPSQPLDKPVRPDWAGRLRCESDDSSSPALPAPVAHGLNTRAQGSFYSPRDPSTKGNESFFMTPIRQFALSPVISVWRAVFAPIPWPWQRGSARVSRPITHKIEDTCTTTAARRAFWLLVRLAKTLRLSSLAILSLWRKRRGRAVERRPATADAEAFAGRRHRLALCPTLICPGAPG
jgi:hypothetical protein